MGCSGALSVLRVGPNTTKVSKFRGMHAVIHFTVSGNIFGSLRIVRLTNWWVYVFVLSHRGSFHSLSRI